MSRCYRCKAPLPVPILCDLCHAAALVALSRFDTSPVGQLPRYRTTHIRKSDRGRRVLRKPDVFG